MGLFRHLLRFSPWAFLASVAASVVSGATGALFVAVVNQALRHAGQAPGLLGWGFALVCVVTVGTRFLSQALLFRLSQQAIYQLRRRLVTTVLSAPLRNVERAGTARLLSSLSDDVVVIADALPGLPAMCSSLAFVLVLMGYLATLSLVVAGGALAAVLVGGLVFRAFAGTGLRHLQRARHLQDELFEHFRAVTEGVKELKLNRRRRLLLLDDRMEGAARGYRRHNVVGQSVFEGAVGGGQIVLFTLVAVLLFVLPGRFGIDSAVLTSSVLTILFAVANVQGVLVWLPVLGRASVALASIDARIGELVGPADVLEGALPAEPDRFGRWSRIDLLGVRHVYPGPKGEEFVLGPLDLSVRRGEVLFVVGGNGSGKTTLAKVLTGLYVPEGGRVLVDGLPIGDTERESYRQLFGAVFTDFFLFDDVPGAGTSGSAGPDGRAAEYLSRLQLDHKVTVENGRLSTTDLSTGQRKRLALLSAYLEDRSCYVFDEWAADQDPVFKNVFYTELVQELRSQGKAVVIISHDDRYFHLADRVVRLDYGRIGQGGIAGGQSLVAQASQDRAS